MYGNTISDCILSVLCADKPQHIMYGNKCLVSIYIISNIDKPQHIMYGNPVYPVSSVSVFAINLNI